ncbi:MAG TPA: histidine phosphatase family protein [Abditibacterium sp.]|jgi:probable phosphoglycerate mutase
MLVESPIPLTQTQIVAIRHGETQWNALGRQQGHADNPLNELGERQSQALAARLQHVPFAALYSSDLQRAAQTGRAIAALSGHEIQLEPRLRERDLGVFEGYTKAEVKEKLPEVFAGYASGDIDYVIPEGESTRQRFERSMAVLHEIAARHAGQTVVVVTHGGVLNGLLRACLHIPLDTKRDFAVFNASFNLFWFEAARWKLATWGDISHLDGIGSKDDP